MHKIRHFIIDYFIDDPEQVTGKDELMFYGIMASPIVILILVLIIS